MQMKCTDGDCDPLEMDRPWVSDHPKCLLAAVGVLVSVQPCAGKPEDGVAA